MNGVFHDALRGRVLGHPVHLMLVHFPAGLLPFALISDLLAEILHEPTLASVAMICYVGGIGGGLLAAVFGAMDYFRISPDHQAGKKASLHALLNVAWLSAFTFVVGTRISQYPHFRYATAGELVVAGCCVVGMMASNYLGGELVLRYGIGTRSGKPELM